MIKIILIVLCTLAILVAGAPFIFGIKAEQNYYQFLDKIGESDTVKIENSTYNRGFLTSRAETSISTTTGSKTVKFFISDKIRHGPFDYSKLISGNRDFRPFLAISHSDIKTDIPVTSSEGSEKIISINMTGYIIININQVLDSRIIIPNYKFIKSKDNIVANWSGLELDMQYNFKTNYFSSSLTSKLLTVEDNDSKLSIKNINGYSNAIGHDDKLSSMTGEYQIKIDELNISSSIDRMNFNNIKISGYSKKDDEILNSGLKIAAEKISLNNENSGSFNTEINLNNIDYKAYSKLQDLSQSKGRKSAHENNQEDIMDILPELLKHSPSLEIPRLNLLSNIGDLKANATIKIKGDNPKLLQNIFLIGTALEAEANLTISKTLADYFSSHELNTGKTPEGELTEENNKDLVNNKKIQQLLDNNILTSDGDNYILNARLINGNLTVNNQPLAVNPMLLNPN